MKLVISISLQNQTSSTQNDMIVEKHREMDGRVKDIKNKVQVIYIHKIYRNLTFISMFRHSTNYK